MESRKYEYFNILKTTGGMDWICPSLVVTGVGGLGTWVGLGWGQQEKATSGSEHATHTVTHYNE